MIETRLYEHLRDQVTGVGGRVFANIMAQDTDKPALVYLVDTGTVDLAQAAVCLGTPPTETKWEIYVYASAYMEAKTIKNEVRDAMASFSPIPDIFTFGDAFEVESELFVQIIKFTTQE